MKVLVTGSSGFIAGYLIPALATEGAEIVGFDLAPPPDLIADKGSFYRGDLSATRDLYRVMATERPTHIVHLASVLAGPCEENPPRGFAINFESTVTLLEAATAVGTNGFVLASSISVFGRGVPEPVADDAPKDPATIYGKTKLASEQVLDWYRQKKGIQGIALRFPWVFGPGRERGITALYSSKLLDAVARREPLVIYNPDETGYVLIRNDFPVTPLLLARILGPLAEVSMRQSLIMSGGSYGIFFTRPICLFFIVLALLSIVFAIFKKTPEMTEY